ncbi:hypothetical protein [Paraburkholderia kirstenboschensis]|uniref:Fis family transcriptional regulator n=1 Tax=Paraburkholderia kirstenboschensis TaxID=1245436 RepID=A0ABZ0EAF7_9BURK|nr:hypothetical protein [Paraburkholderia kirstenboschensis]WOD14223.1 hypothetical protein RW095_01550 [Paraburkholderia kirstenboschensis]
MNRKIRSRKHSRPAMSPLLRALTYSHASLESVTQAMLLRCYIALDAFRRGHGSRNLFLALGRTLLIAEELERLGHQAGALSEIESAQAALVHINAEERASAGWRVCDADYLPLSTALAVFSEQLSAASLNDIAEAQARMLEGLLGSERATRQVKELA